MDDEDRTGEEPLAALRRWQESGAAWRVVTWDPTRATVALLRCDAGEEVDRLTSTDTAWVAYLEGREGSED